ncbi:MAG: hypothetical protein ACYCZ0_01840 [Minisyncoccota bacterium]
MALKKDPRDANRRVQFPEAGQGVYLLLRNSGTRVLHSTYGNDHLQVVERSFLTLDITVLEKMLEFMVWKGEEQIEVSLDDFDDFPIETLVNKVRDAWSLAINGRLYMEQVEHVRAEVRKLTEDPLLKSPEASLEASSDQPSGQA